MPQLRKHLGLPRHTFPTSSTFGCVGEQNLRVRTVSPEKQQTTNVTFVLWTHVSHWQHFDIRHYESMTFPPPNHTRDVAGLVYLEISTATAMHLLLAWSKASNFIFFLQGMETTKVCVISVQNKHKFGRRKQKKTTTPNQISYSFKWIFSPELKLFLNPIFSALNIPCLIAGEKNLPSYLQIKLLPLYLHRPLNRSYVLQTAQGTDCTRNCYIWITSSNISSSLQTAISLPSFMLLIPW